MKQPQRIHYKTLGKQLYVQGNSLELKVLEWITILTIQGLT